MFEAESELISACCLFWHTVGAIFRTIRARLYERARCLRSVAPAMPWARSVNCAFNGEEQQQHPDVAQYQDRNSVARGTAKLRSCNPSKSLASEASLKTFHLSAALPGLISATAICHQTKASVTGHRPKGVVTFPALPFLHLLRGKRNPLTKKQHQELLTGNSGKCNSLVVTHRERLPRRQHFRALCYASFLQLLRP